MPRPLKLSSKMSVMQRILTALEEDASIKTTSDCLSIVPDPHHADVYAGRISVKECKRLDLDIDTERDFIFHADGEIEQGCFEQWPPRSLLLDGHLDVMRRELDGHREDDC